MKKQKDLTKAQEIAYYNSFLDSLPEDSYLNMILKDTKYIVEREILDDFGLPLVSSRTMEQLRSAVDKYAGEVSELKGKIFNFEDYMRRLKRLNSRHIRKFKQIAKRFRRENRRLADTIQVLIENNSELEAKYNSVKSLHDFLGD